MGQPFLCVQRAHGHHTALWSELTAPRPGELGHHLASAVHPAHYKNDLLPSNRLPTPMHRNPVLLGPGSAQQGAPRSLRLGVTKAGSAVRIAGRLTGSRGLVLNSSEAVQRPVHHPAFVQLQLSSAESRSRALTNSHCPWSGHASPGFQSPIGPYLRPCRAEPCREPLQRCQIHKGELVGRRTMTDCAGTCASPPPRPSGALVLASWLDPPSCESARAV
ncbi:uncharacterized protein LOC111530285 [Piliocolobus tephrosceles]|uniref:uncharacterized protein LOC111530285 n=1 Tax=Piliocolobus tephrosceles TaxID=591936 RepID=UPI000C29DCFC|nr:uncharacterized protein LOC111530285 [Piliocolobus tephrosceles]